MRTPILAANWKMFKTCAEARDFAREFRGLVEGIDGVEIVVAPPATALSTLAEAFEGSNVHLAAQNVHPEPEGAFTGEVSVAMLAELGCAYAIVGHSERRSLFGESSDFVASKAAALLARDIRPIVCIGETLDQREAGGALRVCEEQLRVSLAGIPPERATEAVVAYEPVWAIGTGKTATPEIAQEVHGFIREQLTKQFGAAADAMRIQYGGSVKPANIASLMAQPDIDGGLVGGASLDPQSFAEIVRGGRG